MKSGFHRFFVAASCIAACVSVSQSVYAANWLMLQGTEPAGAAPRAKVWGFIQAQYQKDYSDSFNGGYIPPKLIAPGLDSQSGFNVNRARIGVRGTGFPLDTDVNYFFLAEFGNNGVTAADDSSVKVTDASITLNQIKGARVRVGLFKTPIAEEAFQAIHVFDYINFTTVANQMLLERFPEATNTSNIAPPNPTPNASMSAYTRPVAAFRDVGVQVFDTFKSNDWEHSYALMIGNGNGVNYGDNDDNLDLYVYWSSEKVFGGKGPRREGMKIFAWRQDGTRTNAYNINQEQDRTRSGVGFKYLKKPFRVSAEYMEGEGMIFQGQHRPLDIFNDEEAEGYYVEGGWYIPGTKWELDLRYDTYTRGENHGSSAAGDESEFNTITLGTQYHFNKKTRLNVDYASRDNKSDTKAVDNQNKDVAGRLAIQLTHVF